MEMSLSTPVEMAIFAGALLASGAVAGVMAGLLGVGGGIVIVPILYNLLPFLGVPDHVLMHVAVGTSLATIIPTSIMSARSHYKRGSLDMDLVKAWWPAMGLGALIGAVVGSGAHAGILTAIFGVVAVLVSFNMATRKDGSYIRDGLPPGFLKHLIAFVMGGVSVMMGIGGGTLGVPTLSAFNFPIRRAVGTASLLGLIIALPGTVAFIASGLGRDDLPPFSFGYANLIGFAMIVPATVVMAPVGAKIANTINPRALRIAFAVFLGITACRMLYATYKTFVI
jgi:uncharacterized membrane protein YfcA